MFSMFLDGLTSRTSETELTSFCKETADVWAFFGRILFVFKIVIPIILIALGVIALGKAIVADDDKKIKEAVSSLIKKLIAGVIIFFLPTLITSLLQLVGGLNSENSWGVCVTCVKSPTSSQCPTVADDGGTSTGSSTESSTGSV